MFLEEHYIIMIFSKTNPTGLGRNKIIGGGHYKSWPVTNSHIREVNDYTSWHYPKPDWRYYCSKQKLNPLHLRTNGWSNF